MFNIQPCKARATQHDTASIENKQALLKNSDYLGGDVIYCVDVCDIVCNITQHITVYLGFAVSLLNVHLINIPRHRLIPILTHQALLLVILLENSLALLSVS